MMSLFRGSARSDEETKARATAPPRMRRRLNPLQRQAEHPPTPTVPSDVEWRLEQELSAVLSRRPMRHRHFDDQTERSHAYADIEAPEPPPRTLPFVGPHPSTLNQTTEETGETDSLFFVDEYAEEEVWPNTKNAGARSSDLKNTNWLLTARRARRNRGLRRIASWLITIIVGGFIISIAAAILFGIPGNEKFAFRKNAALEAPAVSEPTRTALTKPRWRLD
ncbi:hypothetical protein [Candidatus Filomicrobium marinum]|nr:hypothetical protein [Candidatus Filomicrobium marinum]